MAMLIVNASVAFIAMSSMLRFDDKAVIAKSVTHFIYFMELSTIYTYKFQLQISLDFLPMMSNIELIKLVSLSFPKLLLCISPESAFMKK